MNERDEAFLKRLLETFQVEATDHLQRISGALIELEKAPDESVREQLFETILREAHSMKGAARAVSFVDIESICQRLESIFAGLKKRHLDLTKPLLDLSYDAVDVLDELLHAKDDAQRAGLKNKTSLVLRSLEEVIKGIPPSPRVPKPTPPIATPPTTTIVAPAGEEKEVVPVPEPVTEKTVRTETVRIAAAKLDALLLQAEELLAAKLVSARLSDELHRMRGLMGQWETQWIKARTEMRRLQSRQNQPRRAVRTSEFNNRLTGLTEFMEWNQSFVRDLQAQLMSLAHDAEQHARATGSMVDNLLNETKSALMLPFSTALEGFPKIVRDVAHARGKEAELVVDSGEIEIDKRVLEGMKDALIHLVRNSVDHGLELPPERERLSKPARGTVTIAARQQGGNRIEISVSDDGAGIDAEEVRAKVVSAGLMTKKEAARLSDQQVLAFIFHSGFSTSPVITDISGRGLGLAILREKVERLGGTVSVETTRQVGTTFRILLPLTLATFRGVLVECAGQLFVLPTAGIERVVRVKRAEIKTIENRETILFDGRTMALVRLEQTLEMARREMPEQLSVMAIVLKASGSEIAFAVDGVLGEQEVIVKSLGTQLARVRNIAGATVLGTGQVVPILNVFDLVKSVMRTADTATIETALPTVRSSLSVLIADDSITSRTLLKNVLESAGYRVRTAVDGLDAWATLKVEDFDLVVSDVEMPRLNGFDLTARIRADEKLSELPVILVTALASAEDRARGVDAGANAYIVKSSFDQGNLLEVVRRLI